MSLQSGESGPLIGPMTPFFIKHSHKITRKAKICNLFKQRFSLKNVRNSREGLQESVLKIPFVLVNQRSHKEIYSIMKQQCNKELLKYVKKPQKTQSSFGFAVQVLRPRDSSLKPSEEKPVKTQTGPSVRKRGRLSGTVLKEQPGIRLKQVTLTGFFQPKDDNFTIYLRNYHDFIRQIQNTMQISTPIPKSYDLPPLFCLAQGNNSRLVFSLLSRRWWWQESQSAQESNFVWSQLKRVSVFEKQQSAPASIVHNHLRQNFIIGNKKTLFHTLKQHYTSRGEKLPDFLPLTYHITHGIDDPQYAAFLATFIALQRDRKDQLQLWIVKPGEFTNRGNGITVHERHDSIKKILKIKERYANGQLKTFIVQKYIDRPLLYYRRKFDIRHYLLVTCFSSVIRAYWYEEGYVRTSASQFSLRNQEPFVHLTNDAIQKHDQDYGKFERANKLSYKELDRYVVQCTKGKQDFLGGILPRLKEIAIEILKASHSSLDPSRLKHNFQLFGLDFMLDQNYSPYLIEVNSNPCLELCCPLLARLIPEMLENMLKITIDPLFPPPRIWPNVRKSNYKSLKPWRNRFEHIFTESTQQCQQSSAVWLDQPQEDETFQEDPQLLND